MLHRKPRPEGPVGPPSPASEDSPPPGRRRVPPFHPLLAAAFPVLAFYASNSVELDARGVWRPLAVSLGGTMLAWLVFGLLSRSARKGAVAASLSVLVFFSYGHLVNLAPAALRAYVVPVCLVALIALLVAALRRRGHLLHATAALNLAGVVLVVPSCWSLGVGMYARFDAASREQKADVRRARVFPPAAPDAPDIYYVILDAHGRADRLKLFYGMDNTPFQNALRRRGFYVAQSSVSNYDQTVLSLAASLNMGYLDGLVKQIGRGSNDTEQARLMLDDNAVARYLRRLGYHYVAIGSGNGQVRVTTADLGLHLRAPVAPAERQLLGTTMLGGAKQVRENDYDVRRAYISEAFRYLRSVARLPYPKFVFTHISAPHPPFIFGPDGEARNPSWTESGEDGTWLLEHISADEYRDGYTAQVRYVDTQVLAAVDAIVKGSRRPPIIILQGDHGPRLHLDWNSLARTDLREPFSILNAYLVPDAVRSRLYESITPVNTFRVLLTQRFGGHYPPLPDRTYYSTIDKPYDFTDVTDRVRQP